jgi:hypothetical protein
LLLAGWSDLVVAIAAVNWSAFTRLKRDFGLFAALSADNREHLAQGPCGAIGAQTLRSSGIAAGRAPLRLISVAFSLEKCLFFRGEIKSSAAFNTPELFFFERHQMTSSL